MGENININHGCRKVKFGAEEITRVYDEVSQETHAMCYCSECNRILDLDISDSTSYRKTIRRMFVRQVILVIPDESRDPIRNTDADMHNYAIAFHHALEVFGDDLVAHRELQDPWEQVVLNR